MHFCHRRTRTRMLFLWKSAPVEMTCCFTAAMMVLLLGRYCPHSPSFISLNRWKSGGLTPSPNLEYMVGMIGQFSQDLQCSPQSSNWYGAWCYHVEREKLSSSLAWLWRFEPSAQSVSWCNGQLMVCLVYRKSISIIRFLSQKTGHIT